MSQQTENEKNKRVGSFRLSRVNFIIVSIAVIFALLLTAVTYEAVQNFRQMQEYTRQYIASQQDAYDLQDGSDYLTEQVRAFAVTGERVYLDNYFKEANVTKKRDNALANLEGFIHSNETYDYLRAALNSSNELMEKELYSMALKIRSMGGIEGGTPEDLWYVAISTADKAMEPDEMAKKAVNLVFDDDYKDYKDRIKSNVALCTQTLLDEAAARQDDSSKHVMTMVRVQEALMALMVLTFFIVVFMTNKLAITPLRIFEEKIKARENLPLTGSRELQLMASAYNDMFEKVMANQEELSFAANHDPLTGLYNRNVFDKVRNSDERRAHALLLVDMDKFKDVNDTYGHDTGDMVLKKVAEILKNSFRNEDYVCRIGGDEFAVIMVHAGPELKDLIKGKMDRANEKLADTTDGLPQVSLSVGVAFSHPGSISEDIFKNADQALYRLKNSKRGGCEFY